MKIVINELVNALTDELDKGTDASIAISEVESVLSSAGPTAPTIDAVLKHFENVLLCTPEVYAQNIVDDMELMEDDDLPTQKHVVVPLTNKNMDTSMFD